MKPDHIMILGIGCTLFSDQGFGISVIEAIRERYEFPENVSLVDGGLLGVAMTGTIAQADHLIAVDAFCNGGRPGDIYRLEQRQIFERLAGKNHVQHVDFLEALAHCQAVDHPPETVMLGIEPEDCETTACQLTPLLQDKIDAMIGSVIEELDRLGVEYQKKF